MTKASTRINEIIERLTCERIEESMRKCVAMGFPLNSFDPELARREIQREHDPYFVAIIEYLDELAAKESA